MCALLSVPCGLWAQQTVTLTTSKVGESLTLLVNRTTADITVDWGDGVAQSYSRTDSPWTTITGTAKGATIVVSGSDKFNTLDCSGCGLTAIDLSGATGMQSLFAQNNELTTIDITKLSSLTDIDLSGNQLASLAISEGKNPLLENVNLSGNGMTKQGTSTQFTLRATNLQHVNISGNSFKTAYFTSNPKLDGLQCAGNQFTRLDLSRDTLLSTLVCNDNALTRITTNSTTGLPCLQQIIFDNNSVETLDLSKSTSLYDISCSNNGLTTLSYPSQKLGSMNCGGNALTFAALPVTKNKPDDGRFAYTPQADVDISSLLTAGTNGDASGYYFVQCPSYKDRVTASYQLDLSAQKKDAAGRATVVFTWYQRDNGTPVALEKASATAKDKDYTENSGKFCFLNQYSLIYAELTHADYPDLVLKTTPAFAIGQDKIIVDGIHSVTDDITADTQDSTIYDLQGRRVEKVAKGGIYIVGGKKVYVK